MKMSLRLLCGVALALAVLFRGGPSLMAQQPVGNAAVSAPAAAPVAPPAEPSATEISPASDSNKPDALRQRDFSPWSMFLNADGIVKTVMLSLVFASLVTWTMFIAKSFQMARAQTQVKAALARIADVRSLNEAQV